ncbi:DUF4352 domain-containing protein [Streptomyces sp. HP-A2021]|uniref:DUF4352 domain-containing protein n=1 Tax=Streptomyces sp. HP-A2021 TaxID=2927875 RepID=UPI001FAFB859|nr:DUF4352 domain-containing protein [Streptomyces sp. HP-A2021]UOB09086.1 DUF4352 domain-containing protein [Streptomyces sp. HP-A2021]
MRHRTTITACLLLAGLITGCSSSDEPTVAKATDTPPATSSTPSPSPSPSQETLKLGDTANINAEGKFTATTVRYKDSGIPDVAELLNADQKWAALEIKVCNKDPEPITVTPFPWSLAYTDGARVEATHMTGNELPQPLYPLEAKVKNGDCVRGNVLFQVPKEGRPERVLYSPDVLDEPAEWQFVK